MRRCENLTVNQLAVGSNPTAGAINSLIVLSRVAVIDQNNRPRNSLRIGARRR